MAVETPTDTPAEPTQDTPDADSEVGVLDDLAIEDTQPTAVEPEMDPPVEDEGAKKKDEPTKEEPKKKEEGEPDPETPAKPEDKGEDAPDAASKLFAGEFETREQFEAAHSDLKVAYSESSKEGRRLSSEVESVRDKSSSELKTRDLKIARLEAQVKAGPKPVEATDEEINAMEPAQLLRYNKKHEDWNQQQKQAEREESLETEKVETQVRETKQYIIQRGEAMSKDEKNFPGYSKLIDQMDELMDYAPETLGHRKSPEMLYLAAYGWRAKQRDIAAMTAKETSEEAAKKKSAADAARGGGPETLLTPKTPAGKRKSPDEETDEEYNDRQIKAAQREGGNYFQT